MKLEDETQIDGETGALILGRRHFIQQEDENTTCTFDMKSYADGVVDAYCNITGFGRTRLKKVSTPSLPETYTDEGCIPHPHADVVVVATFTPRRFFYNNAFGKPCNYLDKVRG